MSGMEIELGIAGGLRHSSAALAGQLKHLPQGDAFGAAFKP